MANSDNVIIKWLKKIFSIQFLGVVLGVCVPFVIYLLQKPGDIKVLYKGMEIKSNKTIILSLNFLSADSISIGNKNVYHKSDSICLYEMAFPAIKNDSRNAVQNLTYNISVNKTYLHIYNSNAFRLNKNSGQYQLYNTKETINSHLTYAKPFQLIKGFPKDTMFNIDYSLFISCDGMANERILHYIPYFVVVGSTDLSEEKLLAYKKEFFLVIRNKYADNEFKNIIISIGDSIVEDVKNPNRLNNVSTIKDLNLDLDNNEYYEFWLKPIEPSNDSQIFVSKIYEKSILDLAIFFSPAIIILILIFWGCCTMYYIETPINKIFNVLAYLISALFITFIIFYVIKVLKSPNWDGTPFIYLGLLALPHGLRTINDIGLLDEEFHITYRWSIPIIALSLIICGLLGYNIFCCALKVISIALIIKGIPMFAIMNLSVEHIRNNEINHETTKMMLISTVWLSVCFVVVARLCWLGYI